MLAAIPAWLVVLLHIAFGMAESVGWTQLATRFGYKPEAIETTRMLALNQGAYNAGIAMVLAWSLATDRTPTAIAVLLFIVAMGLVGGATARWTIVVLQSVPAAIAVAALMFMR